MKLADQAIKVRYDCSEYKVKKINIKKALIFWLLTAGYMGLLFYLSSRSTYILPLHTKNIDKIIHIIAYIPLAFLLYLSMERSGLKKYAFLVAFIATIIYGITDELHQSLVPGRDPAIGDVLADSLGAFLGSLGASFTKA